MTNFIVMKIRIQCEEHCIASQKVLFALGYSWANKHVGATCFEHTDAAYALFTTDAGEIFYYPHRDNAAEHYQNHSGIEHVLNAQHNRLILKVVVSEFVAMKILCGIPKHTQQVCDKLQELGYEWTGRQFAPATLSYKNIYAIYTGNDGKMSYDFNSTNVDKLFEKDSNMEFILWNDELIQIGHTKEPESDFVEEDVALYDTLMPKWESDNNRVLDILAAMTKCASEYEQIPQEWLDELNEKVKSNAE